MMTVTEREERGVPSAGPAIRMRLCEGHLDWIGWGREPRVGELRVVDPCLSTVYVYERLSPRPPQYCQAISRSSYAVSTLHYIKSNRSVHSSPDPLLTFNSPLSSLPSHPRPPSPFSPPHTICATSMVPSSLRQAFVLCARSSSLAVQGRHPSLLHHPSLVAWPHLTFRCPHKHDVCKNSALHPRHDVVHMRNAEGTLASSIILLIPPFLTRYRVS